MKIQTRRVCVCVSNCSTKLHTGENHTEEIQLHEPVNLTLACTWTGNQKKLPNISVYWTKDGKTIQDSERSVQLENEQYTLKQE